jgi:hypothetical protein
MNLLPILFVQQLNAELFNSVIIILDNHYDLKIISSAHPSVIAYCILHQKPRQVYIRVALRHDTTRKSK